MFKSALIIIGATLVLGVAFGQAVGTIVAAFSKLLVA